MDASSDNDFDGIIDQNIGVVTTDDDCGVVTLFIRRAAKQPFGEWINGSLFNCS